MSVDSSKRKQRVRRSVRLPSISFIVARSYPENIIGCDNSLPWKLKTDLKRFREISLHHAVIMGRKTLDSIGRPLPHRFNVILSRSAPEMTGDIMFVSNRESALFFSDFYSILQGHNEYFVIGGEQVYAQFSDLFSKIYLTQVFSEGIKGDSFFPAVFSGKEWRTVDEIDFPKTDSDEWPYRFSILRRRDETVRVVDISNFLTRDEKTEEYTRKMIEKYRHKKILKTDDEIEQILMPWVA